MKDSHPALSLTSFDSVEGSGRFAGGALGAVVLHALLLGYAMTSTGELGSFARSTLEHIRDRWTLTYEVEEIPEPPPPVAEEKPEPEPPPPPQATAEPTATPAEPPPAPAEAAQVLTQEPDPDAPLDLTGEGFVTGNAESYSGGYTSAKGPSKGAVNQKPGPAGVVGGTGKPTAPKVSALDLSKPATWVSGDILRQCGFPPEADAAQVDFARVVLTVAVSDTGATKAVTVLSETPSGLGFGSRARSCANRTQFTAGRDRNGRPIASTAGPITVNFTRAR